MSILGKILTLAAQKGGEGKSTIVMNIVCYFLLKGLKVVLVDADRQGTSKNWSSDRTENSKLKQAACVTIYGDVRSQLKKLQEEYDIVVVDVAGHDSEEMRTALLVSDMVVIPVLCSQPDLDTIPFMQKLVKKAEKFNKNLKAYLLLSRTPTNPKVTEVKEARDFLSSVDIVLLKSYIAERKVFRDAVKEGKSVFEMGNNKAAKEMNELMKEIDHGL